MVECWQPCTPTDNDDDGDSDDNSDDDNDEDDDDCDEDDDDDDDDEEDDNINDNGEIIKNFPYIIVLSHIPYNRCMAWELAYLPLSASSMCAEANLSSLWVPCRSPNCWVRASAWKHFYSIYSTLSKLNKDIVKQK